MSSANFHLDQLEFRVERWSNGVPVELLAALENIVIGNTTFEAVVAMYPSDHIVLRHRARVVAQHNHS